MALKVQLVQPHEEAIALIRDKPAVTREVFDRLLPELRVRAFTVTGIEAAELLQRLRDEIATLPAGKTWDEVKAHVADALPFEPEAAQRRAELLLRIHGFQAFQAAVWRVAQADPQTTHLQYLTMEDARVRPAHRALDGVVLPKDDPFWEDHMPPWDWGCRCRVRPLNTRQVDQIRQADLRNPPEARRVLEGPALRQLRHGTRITPEGQRVDVTPPRFKPGGSSAFQWHPDSLLLPLEQLRKRFDPEVWAAFESWARSTPVTPEQTLWEAMQQPARPSQPQRPSKRSQAKAAVQQVTDKLARAGFSPILQEAARKMPEPMAQWLRSAEFRPAKSAYYQAGVIHLNQDPLSWYGRTSTLYHECGHHACEMAGVYKGLLGPSPALSQAMSQDMAGLEKRLDEKMPEWRQRLRRENFQDDTMVALGKALGYLYPGDPRSGLELTTHEKHKITTAADTLLCLSRGRYGTGHSLKYVRQMGWYAEPPAHATAAILEGDAIFQRLFPHLCHVVKSMLGL